MSFIVIIGQIVGNPENGYGICWSSDMEEKRTLKAAIRHGLKHCGSDDFRIGQKCGEWLSKVSWMGEKFFDGDEVAEIADQLGMKTRMMGLGPAQLGTQDFENLVHGSNHVENKG